jgi:hypothetical protein
MTVTFTEQEFAMKNLAPLLAETAADVYEGFEDWFAGVIRRAKRHRQQIPEFRQAHAQFGLSRRLVAVITLSTLAFRPTDPVARRPRPGSRRYAAERQLGNSWVGRHELPGAYL